MENQRRITSLGISLGESNYCLSVDVGDACSLYIHGTTDQVRALAQEIIDEANRHDAAHNHEFASVLAEEF